MFDEVFDRLSVCFSLKWDHLFPKLFGAHPFTCIKFVVRSQREIWSKSWRHTDQEPFLDLTPIPATELDGNLIGQPRGMLSDNVYLFRCDAGFLDEFSQRGLKRFLADFDAALRTLPRLRARNVAGPSERQNVAIAIAEKYRRVCTKGLSRHDSTLILLDRSVLVLRLCTFLGRIRSYVIRHRVLLAVPLNIVWGAHLREFRQGLTTAVACESTHHGDR